MSNKSEKSTKTLCIKPITLEKNPKYLLSFCHKEREVYFVNGYINKFFTVA